MARVHVTRVQMAVRAAALLLATMHLSNAVKGTASAGAKVGSSTDTTTHGVQVLGKPTETNARALTVAADGHVSPPTTDGHVYPPTTDGHVSPPTPDRHVSPPTPDGHVYPPTTDGHVSPPTPDRHVSPPTTDGHVSPPTSDGHDHVSPPTPDRHVSPPTTDGHVSPPTSDGHDHVSPPTPDGHVSPPTSDGHVSLPTAADGHVSPATAADGHVFLPTTDGHVFLPTTDGHVSPPTAADGHVSPPTAADGHVSHPTADGHVSPPTTPGPLQAAVDYLNLTSDQVTDCLRRDGELQVSAKRGQLDVFPERNLNTAAGTASTRDYLWCTLAITAPRDRIWHIRFVELIPMFCGSLIFVSDVGSQRDAFKLCGYKVPLSRYSASNTVFLTLRVANSPILSLVIRVLFTSVPASSRPQLEVHRESSSHGYIHLPPVGGRPAFEPLVNSWVGTQVPDGHTVMLSFEQVYSADRVLACLVNVYLYIGVISDENLEASLCANEPYEPAVYRADQFYVHIRSNSTSEQVELEKAFKVYFSFHSDSSQPQRLADGRWNCSVPHWPDFRYHFPCNLVAQCVNGEDEGGCSYTTTKCGDGFFSAGGSCFTYRIPDRKISWNDAYNECVRLGTQLASLNTAQQWDEVVRLLALQHFTHLYVGMRAVGSSLPRMYRAERGWLDGTVDHFKRIRLAGNRYSCSTFPRQLAVLKTRTLTDHSCQSVRRAHFVCEKESETSPQTPESRVLSASVVLADIADTFATTNLSRSSVICPEGHATHAYLACDMDSACWGRGVGRLETTCNAPLDPLPPLFSCRSRAERVPYPLVCDRRPDCKDGSDEDFCVYPPCALSAPFYCSARQCVPRDRLCDGQADCHNDADEDSCGSEDGGFTSEEREPPPGQVRLERTGRFVVRPLEEAGNETNARCPATHFRCVRSEPFYCLPVHLRCNGVYDCPSHEDEAGCDTYTCPGYYRCRASRVCVHPDRVCDGIHHCPQHDDELLCDLRCPDHCLCYGTAFFCSASLTADLYPPELRFLEARETGTPPADLASSTMLVHLGLARCRLTRLELPRLPNLQSLDLSDNGIASLNREHFALLPNLCELSLAGNPLTSSLFTEGIHQQVFESVIILDISRIPIPILNVSVFSAFSSLKTLNLSGNGVQQIMDGGFQSLTDLRLLDLRGSPIAEFPPNIFHGLRKLETVFADNYKLCCPVNLPAHFNPADCHAPVDEVSSCDNLLRSNVYRAFLSLFAVLALLGNLCSFGFRVFLAKQRAGQAFGVFVTHLCVSDLLMGAYLAVVGVADRLYQGTYVWEDRAWRTSAFCGLAGFLSLLSSEVSAFLICLITLDRFLVLRFPFSRVRFGRASAHGACLAAWLSGVLLAAAPLLPQTAHWEFYSQTGICIPLPVTRKAFPGQSYSFAVMILLNFVLFLFIAVGQVVIYWSIRSNSLTATTDSTAAGGTRKTTSRDLTIARRLLTVAASDFLCWFPIGVLGLAASAGRRVPGEVSVAVAIFVLPLNSALNPFLYTLNMALERRERAREERLTAILVSRLKSTKTSSTTH